MTDDGVKGATLRPAPTAPSLEDAARLLEAHDARVRFADPPRAAGVALSPDGASS